MVGVPSERNPVMSSPVTSDPGRPEDDSTADVQRDPRRRWGRGRRVLAGAALATGLAVGGAAVAAAVSTGGSRQVADAGTRGFGGPGMRGTLHGELTVPQTDGTGTQVVLVQSGTVTAVSATSLSVKSTDGFTATYAITSTTRVRAKGGTGITGVASGATVWVVSSSSHSALMVADRAGGMRGMQGRHGQHDADGDDTALDAPGATADL